MTNRSLMMTLLIAALAVVGCGAADDAPPAPTLTPTATRGEHTSPVLLPQIPIVVSFPDAYLLRDNTHPTIPNYRGQIVAYYFVPPDSDLPAMLQDMAFYSEESIQAFQDDCPLSQAECDYFVPDLAEYRGQKAAFEAGTGYGDATLMQIGDHSYLVVQEPPQGEQPHIREYVIFLGDIRVFIWVWMVDADQAEAADALIAQLVFTPPGE